jgi:hypothetical protein
MNAQPDQTAQPLHNLDHLVGRYLDLKHESEEIASQMEHVKDQLRALGVGQHETAAGVTVTVQAPARRFNLDRAWSLLTPEQQAVCVAPAAAKVKAQLAPIIAESCYDAGTGAPTVKVGG